MTKKNEIREQYDENYRHIFLPTSVIQCDIPMSIIVILTLIFLKYRKKYRISYFRHIWTKNWFKYVKK